MIPYRFLALIGLLGVFLGGCSAVNVYMGYNSLPPGEKVYYQELADSMTIEQRMEYLQIPEADKRQAYLEEIGVVPKSAAKDVALSKPVASAAPVSPTIAEPSHPQPVAKTAQESLFSFRPEDPKTSSSEPVAVAKAAPPTKSLILPPAKPPAEIPSANAPVAPASSEDLEEEPLLEHEKQALLKEKQEAQEKPVIQSPVQVTETAPEEKQSYNEFRESMLTQEENLVPSDPSTDISAHQPKIGKEVETEMEVLREKQLPVVTAPKDSPLYSRTGDPVKDVLSLLDLYESGKISKDVFEHEKEIALQTRTPEKGNTAP
jgi:hypothetical protein